MRSARGLALSALLPTWVNRPVLPMIAGNEIRAIFPAWVTMMLMTAVGFIPAEYGTSFAVIGYALGCSAIGATAFGHDFTHRTLVTTLSQPFERERLWRMRLTIAFGAMVPLITMAAMQESTFSFLQLGWSGGLLRLLAFVAPLLVGLFVAPWVTLTCRSALAGTVFSVGTPFFLKFVSDLGVLAGVEGDWLSQTGLFQLFLFSACGWGGFAGRRKFLRLEANEGAGRTSRLNASKPSGARREARSDSPAWMLVRKELRLQWLAVVPALGLWGTLLVWQFRVDPLEALPLLAIFWAGLTCLLLGAIGSAEERQFGMTQSQFMLPMAAWKQWALKSGVVIGLAFLLVIAIPAVLLAFGPWRYSAAQIVRAAQWFTPLMLTVVIVSLYVSSLCGTSMKAILLSMPLAWGAAWALTILYWNPLTELTLGGHVSARPVFEHGLLDVLKAAVIPWPAWFFLAILFLILLVVAGKRHFSAERS